MARLTSILILLSLLTFATAFGQTDTIKVKKQSFDLTGIWILTDYTDPKKFSDMWEFKADGKYYELKYKKDGSSELVPDENGTWSLTDITLTIIVTGEYTNGEPHRYEKPITWSFKLTEDGKDLKLDILSDSTRTSSSIATLRLTKYK
jgi:Lipocalin-like domain